MKKVLVTGGAGYIGSHCCKAFSRAGWDVAALDNLSRGNRAAIRWGHLYEGDVADTPFVKSVLEEFQPDIVAHFAAFAYVGESVEHPELYYANNVGGTLSLLEAMRAEGCSRLIFSSTCATYGDPVYLPIDEKHPQQPVNPYGWSKFTVERMLEDYAAAHSFSSVILRYFNAAGCDPEGEIGEDHSPETHALPLLITAALDSNAAFFLNGCDFDTPDGSAIRDFIHVSDLANAHVAAGERLLEALPRAEAFNLGTGSGISILELVKAVEKATGRTISLQLRERRTGDPAVLVAAADRACKDLKWQPRQSGLFEIIDTALAWQRNKQES
ncbi:UDP-glucose 4-epimerase GalE [Sphingobium phenoxybenzoativorans]|uniref:UDP-glucose 4-epimerase n=1 Tax=Sphingobium phenoxybenzoativorans TaxID=1592790 RepID=A0A975K7V0_9SPHN|nr:UDP-glucose 4-epimerase GalE [Sphingobium phenoxybenzoativorans]QUT05688.1 UDP-glucose 4-epimerase GalE [Sphingobium phenoxybenzoativorans]